MIDKLNLANMLLSLFEHAEQEEDRPIPHSKKNIEIGIEERGDLLEKLDDPELSDEEEISIFYELFHHIILLEIYDITWELDKKGFLESGVNEEGKISFTLTDKGINYLS